MADLGKLIKSVADEHVRGRPQGDFAVAAKILPISVGSNLASALGHNYVFVLEFASLRLQSWVHQDARSPEGELSATEGEGVG